MLGVTRWDYGVTWLSRRIVEPTDLPISVPYIRDSVLRVTNGAVEDEFIERAIRAAVQVCEDETQTAVMLQTWEQVLSGFPAGGVIELVRPPFVGLVSVGYYDGDGDLQSLNIGSPAETEVIVSPSGPYSRAFMRSVIGATWPASATRGDAVMVSHESGYADADLVPPNLIAGIGMMVSEMYKQRSLSQVGTSIVAAPLDTSRFWRRVW